MPTKQGDLSLLNDPVAQMLLNAPLPAHLAYTWMDGTPRVVPLALTWNGKELVGGTPSNAPKLKALKDGSPVAVTIDTVTAPIRVLYIRGVIHLEPWDGIVPEWAMAAERIEGKEAAAQSIEMVDSWMKAGECQFVRLSITPTWVAIHDFETRLPSAFEKTIEAMTGR